MRILAFASAVHWSALALVCGLLSATGLLAQQDKAAALKQSLAENKKRLTQYKWIETTIVKLKGEEKSRVQKLCFYGPDGKVQKQQISAPAQPKQSPGGLKGKAIAKKKEELTGYMQQAVVLIHQYVPPDKERVDKAKATGGLSVGPVGPGAVRLLMKNYFKNGDEFNVDFDSGTNSIQTIAIRSWLEKPDDVITLSVTFARQNDLSYPANIVLNAPGKKLEVTVVNSNYELVAPQQARAPAQPPAASSGIDKLTGPIALYPDALIAQILTAAGNSGGVQQFAGWTKQNANLKGSELQDAAQAAGFDAALVALAPFPQVIQMMVEKPDWTKQLGQAFVADQDAVFASIQRLRQQAQSLGNLKSTPQQQVTTQTTSSGQQVIVVQPANPQVVYVPQYNPQVVYVSAPPPPPPSGGAMAATAAISFTAGVIIGANSTHYYHGPYAWHGAAMYHEAWEQRYEYAEHRQNTYQQNATQRQNTAQANQTQRQTTAQGNQAQRQSAAQANQSQRQSAYQSAQGQAGAGARPAPTSATQGNMQAQRAQRTSGAATASFGAGQSPSQRSGMQSGGFSGYQSGSSARAQSARGNSSLSGSRGGGRRRG